MKVGILGSGNVGQALAKGLVAEGHEVWLATREPESEKANELKSAVPEAAVCDFATAAENAELAILCVPWKAAQAAVEQAGAKKLASKTVVDTSNAITQLAGMLAYDWQGKSAAEQVQAWLPDSKVVKAFNTVGADEMYKPQFDTTPTMFTAGDDEQALREVNDIISSFGWEPLNSGGLLASRDLEAMALVWIRNSAINGRHHAFKML